MRIDEDGVCWLDDFSMGHVLTLATRRQAAKEAGNVPERRNQATREGFDLHFVGAMGEYAAARFLGVKLDTSVKLSGDDGTDLTYRGQSIEVKTSSVRVAAPMLVVNDEASVRASLLLLAHVQTPTSVRLCGWIERERFIRSAIRTDFGYGPRLAVPQSILDDMDTLRNGSSIA